MQSLDAYDKHWLTTDNKLVFSTAAATLSLSASCLLTTTTTTQPLNAAV